MDRPHGTEELRGDLGVGPTLEVMEHDRRAVVLGEPVDLRVECRAELAALERVDTASDWNLLQAGPHMAARTIGDDPGPGCHPVGDPVEPAPQHLPVADGAGLAGEDQKRGLEGVLSVVGIVQYAPADAQYHRPVRPHDGLECSLIAVRHESLQQPPLAGPDHRPIFEKALDAPEQGTSAPADWHRHPPRPVSPRFNTTLHC